MSAATPYSSQFYGRIADRSSRSAGVVVPLFLSLYPIRSVVDVGCGIGVWTREFLAHGVSDVLGIDGDYVQPSQLLIRSDVFMARDLRQPLRLDRQFDAAVCLEVGEHLPGWRADSLIADLTTLAPCVLFSAAVPGQGGTDHINEQYLPFWSHLFARHGYIALDAIRPHIIGNDDVAWWYQQNIVVFVGPGHPLRSRGLPAAHSMIHQQLYEPLRRPTVSRLIRSFPGAVLRSVRFRLGRT